MNCQAMIAIITYSVRFGLPSQFWFRNDMCHALASAGIAPKLGSSSDAHSSAMPAVDISSGMTKIVAYTVRYRSLPAVNRPSAIEMGVCTT